MVLIVAILAISFPVNITIEKLPVHTNNIIISTDLYNLLKTQRLSNRIEKIGDNTEKQFWRKKRLSDRIEKISEWIDKRKEDAEYRAIHTHKYWWRRGLWNRHTALPSPSPEPENYMESSNLNQEAEDYNPDLFWIKDAEYRAKY